MKELKSDERTGLPHHIPDERIAVWREKTVEELMAMSQRLHKHIDTLADHDQADEMKYVADDLDTYIESRIRKSDIDLDVML